MNILFQRQSYYFLLIAIAATFATEQKKYFFPIIPRYNLKSDDRYTKYLPARIRALKTILKNSGVNEAIEFIRKDRDLESYLFILSTDTPKTLCAYSRSEDFFGKTAQELQKLIFPSHAPDSEYDINVIFNQWISTARKGDTFIPYRWKTSTTSPEIVQVAYVSRLQNSTKTYIIGAASTTPFIPNHIILPHRSKTILKHYKNNDIAKFFSYINDDPVKYLYFFAGTMEPLMEIANGQNPNAIGQTPEMQQQDVFPDCQEETCNMMLVFNKAIYLAKHGGGHMCYLWHSFTNEPVTLKLAYIHPFSYHNSKMYLGSGYTPFNFPERLQTQLPQTVEKAIKLIKDVGINNTRSTLKKENNNKLYVFIIEQQPPYKNILDLHPELEVSSHEATKKSLKLDPNYTIDYTKFRRDIVRFAQQIIGWYAYEYKPFDKTIPSMLKIAYIKPFVFENKKYIIGATYQNLE